MKITAVEQYAIRQVLDAGAAFGYGNMITHLQTAWAKRLMESGLTEKAARAATGRDIRERNGYPFAMQADLIDNGEWDETGARYAKPRQTKGGKRGR